MKKEYIWNPKVRGSGLITCIPQKGECPNKCEDCFFQSGRSYLEPFENNLPHIPPLELTKGRIVRMNDGNDSNVERDIVESTAKQYQFYFFNTAIPTNLESFSGPVVLTINPAKMTDRTFFKIAPAPKNLMFIRIRINLWNIENIAVPAIEFYSKQNVAIVLTFMAYYTSTIPDKYKNDYEWKKRTLNSYWVLKQEKVDEIANVFSRNPHVYLCGTKGRYECSFCGNCIREYFNTRERMVGLTKRNSNE